MPVISLVPVTIMREIKAPHMSFSMSQISRLSGHRKRFSFSLRALYEWLGNFGVKTADRHKCQLVSALTI
jgi:hypothetical protein